MTHSCAGAFLRKVGWMQYSPDPAPSSPTVDSLLRTPWPEKLTLKFGKKLGMVNGKIHSASFDQTHLAKSMIWLSRILPYYFQSAYIAFNYFG